MAYDTSKLIDDKFVYKNDYIKVGPTFKDNISFVIKEDDNPSIDLLHAKYMPYRWLPLRLDDYNSYIITADENNKIILGVIIQSKYLESNDPKDLYEVTKNQIQPQMYLIDYYDEEDKNLYSYEDCIKSGKTYRKFISPLLIRNFIHPKYIDGFQVSETKVFVESIPHREIQLYLNTGDYYRKHLVVNYKSVDGNYVDRITLMLVNEELFSGEDKNVQR